MPNPWDNDPIISPAPAAAAQGAHAGNPWDNDPIIAPAPAAHTSNAHPAIDQAQIARDVYDNSAWYEKPLIAAGAEFNSLVRGIGQLLTPNDSEIHKQLTASADADAPFQEGIHGIGGLVGRALPYLATIPLGSPEAAALSRAGQVGTAARLGIKAATAAAEGAGYGALHEVRTGEDRGDNAALGAAAGLGGRALVGGAASAATGLLRGAAQSIDPIIAQSIATAQRYGIPLHASQVSDSAPVKMAASIAKYLPFSGAGAAGRAQQNAWNKALTSEAGDAAERLDDPWVTAQKQRFGNIYDSIWSRNDVTVMPQTAMRMAQIVRDSYRDLGGDGGKVVENQFNRVMDDITRAGQNGTISGKNYQTLRSALAKVQPGTPVGQAVGRLRAELINDANASVAPADLSLLRKTDQQYNNFKTLEKLLTRPAGAKADVSPAALWSAVNQRGPKATPEMRDLAKVGQNLLKDPIPQNGLIGSSLGSLLTGGAGFMAGSGGIPSALGTIAGGATVGRVLNSPAFANYLVNGLGRPGNVLTNIIEQGQPATNRLAISALMDMQQKKKVASPP